MLATKETEIARVFDIPEGWGENVEEFRTRVIQIIERASPITKSARFDIENPDGSVTPFYPVFCATTPEWGVITDEEIRGLVRKKLEKYARSAHVVATVRAADHIYGEEYLAWGLQEGIFSPDEISDIRFDHGDTPESYVRDYGQGDLLSKFVDRLKHPYSELPLPTNWISAAGDDCCCDCCH